MGVTGRTGVGPFDGLLGAKTVSTSKTLMFMSWTWRAAPTVVRGRMEEELCSFCWERSIARVHYGNTGL